MRNNKLYKEIAIIVCFALAALAIHVIMWMRVTKTYINDNSDFVKERLVVSVFFVVVFVDFCFFITNICFELEVDKGEEVLDISVIMRLRYYGEDGRRWICEDLAADDYRVIRVDTYVLKAIGR